MLKLILFGLLSQIAVAGELEGEWYVGGGFGVFTKYVSRLKTLNFGRKLETRDSNPFKLLIDVGYYDDSRPNRNPSLTVAALVGPELKNNFGYISLFSGPGVLAAPDPTMGGPFQFFHELSIGIIDYNTQLKLGGFCRHISNAGIYNRNEGKDFCGFKFHFGF